MSIGNKNAVTLKDCCELPEYEGCFTVHFISFPKEYVVVNAK